MRLPLLLALFLPLAAQGPQGYPVVGTGQVRCFDDRREIPAPAPGAPFFGQDAQHPGPAPAYRDLGDGIVQDSLTGLQWVQARGEKMTFEEAQAGAAACRVGGHRDWRMPTIKELYSLIQFQGAFRPGGGSVPFLDTRVFGFRYGDPGRGERTIDCQDWSATPYLGTTMAGDVAAFGVNFADGRIKGYPRFRGPGRIPGRLYVRYVRGNPAYGHNRFRDNRDGTVTDEATGLIWSREDSGRGMDWEEALAWVQARNRERWLGHSDWRLPDAKELQSLVDYDRAPFAGNPSRRGPALNPVFHITPLGDGDFPYFWTSTTHLDGPPDRQGGAAVYVAFGTAPGWMRFPGAPGPRRVDVHGAGAQRSDPKTGDPGEFPQGRGPQGDEVRILNFVRPVR